MVAENKQKTSGVLCGGAAALGCSQAAELDISSSLLCRDVSQKTLEATWQ